MSRHSFGGSALDRYVYDFEPSDGPDGGDTTAAASPSDTAAADSSAGSATTEPGSSSGATDAAAAAPVFSPEQIAALRDDPSFREYLSEEAAAIADARISQLATRFQPGGGNQTPAGDDVDLNEYLNPLGDNFGQNLMHVLSLVTDGIDSRLEARFAPLSEQQEALAAERNDQMLKTAITDTASQIGELKGGDPAVERVMAAVRNVYMPQAAAMYGQTDRAAQIAIDKAIRAELDYQRSISGTAAVDSAQHLALVHNAPNGVTGNGAAAVTTNEGQILSDRELVQKYSGLAAAIRGQ